MLNYFVIEKVTFLQTVCNSNLEITNVITHWQGSIHDSIIFNNSRLRANFEDGAFGNDLLLRDSTYFLKPYLVTLGIFQHRVTLCLTQNIQLTQYYNTVKS